MLSSRVIRSLWSEALRRQCFSSSSSTFTPQKLIFNEFGNPKDVLKLVDDDVAVLEKDLDDGEVLLRVLASPVNPSDINFVQGVYAIKPKSWPAISGNEGVMEVLKTGPQVKDYRPGDRVLPVTPGLGLWRSHIRLQANKLLQVDSRLSLPAAATLIVNPCTAYRLLADFADLKPGDWVLQNAATSAVGLFVIQMCRERGLRSCNVIRARSSDAETEATRNVLKDFGADLVLTQEELRDKKATRTLKEAGGAKVTFNCVGGKQVLSLISLMSYGSSLVTYGAMAMAPMAVPAGPLIFKDLALRGYWMSAWSQRPENEQERRRMLDALAEEFVSGRLRLPPYQEVPLKNFETALESNQFGGKGPTSTLPTKQLLVMT